MRRLLLIAAMATFVAVAGAEPPPTAPEFEDGSASMNKEPTKGLTLGKFRVQFETTTLSQVQHAVSAGEIAYKAAGGESILWLCYTARRNRSVERIWIISSADMGGPEHAVTEIAVRLLKDQSPKPDCPSLPSSMQPASLDIPVWLGSSDADLDRTLGPPSHRVGAWRSYYFGRQVTGDCELGNWLETKSERGNVTSIFAGQITSC